LSEGCESEVANLLASLDNLPKLDVDAKIAILTKILQLQQKQIENLQEQLDEHEEDYEHVQKPCPDEFLEVFRDFLRLDKEKEAK
jgi:recombinational DNA repair protein RecR